MRNNADKNHQTSKKHKPIEVEKKQLRKYIQNKRDNLALGLRNKKSKEIALKFLKTRDYLNSKNIFIFYPFRSEIDTTIIIKKALKESKNIILPRVEGTLLNLYFINDVHTQLQEGSYGIMEPIPSSCIKAYISDINLAIVPGVAFDKNLNRLGYGGGFYDKILKNLPQGIKKIALSFDVQIVSNIPVLGYDIKIDMLITESKIYKAERIL
ncbi:MAG: 5-formyltetrahydrofolate cyclo-ligase [Actinobacteria bacterium]|nr:5-formyltetrahydrofolate cyclo-ligase [Actinomycetota bacterium]